MRPRMTPGLRRAYHRTEYTVSGITLRIGRRSAGMDRLLRSWNRREAAFITAYNPYSRPMPPGWNRRMQQRLLLAARRWPVLPASGQWRRWREAHLVILAPRPCATVLARRFRQHGIVMLRRGQPALLVFT
ncbi:DUF3293 domain-containing protein [Rhodopila globiformis]|uniref:DUF3293 domain-containing protein n=1 Tax=Rhodopila globiformis TaxID=1071 RepID=A0A2S6NLQ7_RHOGL|nr:hypothetical protein CCS01_05060 [Rhodopila globiformis]